MASGSVPPNAFTEVGGKAQLQCRGPRGSYRAVFLGEAVSLHSCDSGQVSGMIPLMQWFSVMGGAAPQGACDKVWRQF